MSTKDLREKFKKSKFKSYLQFLENYIEELEKKDFHRFLKMQIKEMENYKWIESQKAGRDLGNECCDIWIKKFAKDFKKWYYEEI